MLASQSYFIKVAGRDGATSPDYELQIDGPDPDDPWPVELRLDEGQWTPDGGGQQAEGTIRIGPKPENGADFNELIIVDGAVWYDADTIRVDGTVKARVDGMLLDLFAGNWDLSVDTDRLTTTSLLEEAAARAGKRIPGLRRWTSRSPTLPW